LYEKRQVATNAWCPLLTPDLKEVTHPRPIEGVEVAFELIAIPVLARKMDQGFDAEPQDLQTKVIGKDGGVATGIVRNRDRIDSA
jgi:hypothetical protein